MTTTIAKQQLDENDQSLVDVIEYHGDATGNSYDFPLIIPGSYIRSAYTRPNLTPLTEISPNCSPMGFVLQLDMT